MHFNLVGFFSWVYFLFLEIHLLHEYEHCKFYGFEIMCFPGIGLDFSIAFYLMFSLQQLKYYITNFSYELIMLFSFLGILFPGFFFPGNTSSSWRWTWPNFMVCDYAFFRDWVGFIKRFLDYVFSFIIINLWVTNAFFFWIFHILEFHLQEHQH